MKKETKELIKELNLFEVSSEHYGLQLSCQAVFSKEMLEDAKHNKRLMSMQIQNMRNKLLHEIDELLITINK